MRPSKMWAHTTRLIVVYTVISPNWIGWSATWWSIYCSGSNLEGDDDNPIAGPSCHSFTPIELLPRIKRCKWKGMAEMWGDSLWPPDCLQRVNIQFTKRAEPTKPAQYIFVIFGNLYMNDVDELANAGITSIRDKGLNHRVCSICCLAWRWVPVPPQYNVVKEPHCIWKWNRSGSRDGMIEQTKVGSRV